MKQLILLILLLLSPVSNADAQTEWNLLNLQVKRIDSNTNGFPSGRSSIAIPSIYTRTANKFGDNQLIY